MATGAHHQQTVYATATDQAPIGLILIGAGGLGRDKQVQAIGSRLVTDAGQQFAEVGI